MNFNLDLAITDWFEQLADQLFGHIPLAMPFYIRKPSFFHCDNGGLTIFEAWLKLNHLVALRNEVSVELPILECRLCDMNDLHEGTYSVHVGEGTILTKKVDSEGMCKAIVDYTRETATELEKQRQLEERLQETAFFVSAEESYNLLHTRLWRIKESDITVVLFVPQMGFGVHASGYVQHTRKEDSEMFVCDDFDLVLRRMINLNGQYVT